MNLSQAAGSVSDNAQRPKLSIGRLIIPTKGIYIVDGKNNCKLMQRLNDSMHPAL